MKIAWNARFFGGGSVTKMLSGNYYELMQLSIIDDSEARKGDEVGGREESENFLFSN